MSRPNLRHRGKTTPSPRRTRSSKAREPTPESESESDSEYSERDPKSTGSTPPSGRRYYPRLGPSPDPDLERSRSYDQQVQPTPSPTSRRSGKDREPLPEFESDSESSERNRIQNTNSYISRESVDLTRSNESTPSSYQGLYPCLEPPPHSSQPSKSLNSSPGSSTKSSKTESPLNKQGIHPGLRKRFSDDDLYDDTDDKQDRKDNWQDQFGEKIHRQHVTFHDPISKRSKEYLTLESLGQSKHKHFDDENYNGLNILCIFVIGAITILAILWFILPSSGPEEDNHETQPLSRYELFSIDIKELRHHFPSQKDRLWRSVIASSRHVLKEPNSTYPSVILLASQVKSPRLSFCIAEKIASSFVKSHGINPGPVPTTDIEAIKDFEASEQKLKLDNDIQTALEKPSGKAYIIQNLQTLSPQAALLLHGLCDGDNAPYKDVMILMTLELKETMPAKTAHEIENYLTQLWTTTQVEYDKVAAVMSRISNNLVIIEHENPASVEKVCPIY